VQYPLILEKRIIRKKGGWNFKKIFSSETTEPISTKLRWNDSWVVLFQNCVRHLRTSTNMVSVTINRTVSQTTKLHLSHHYGVFNGLSKYCF
jgi:hypothetical protein